MDTFRELPAGMGKILGSNVGRTPGQVSTFTIPSKRLCGSCEYDGLWEREEQKLGADTPPRVVELSSSHGEQNRTPPPNIPSTQTPVVAATPIQPATPTIISTPQQSNPTTTTLSPGSCRVGIQEKGTGMQTTSTMTGNDHIASDDVRAKQPTTLKRDSPSIDRADTKQLADSKDIRPARISKESPTGSGATEDGNVCFCRGCRFCKEPWKFQYCTARCGGTPHPSDCNICRAIHAIMFNIQRNTNPGYDQTMNQLQNAHLQTISSLNFRHQEETAILNGLYGRAMAELTSTKQALQDLQEKDALRSNKEKHDELDHPQAQRREEMSKLEKDYAWLQEEADRLLAQEQNEKVMLQERYLTIEAKNHELEQEISKFREDSKWYIGVLNHRKADEIANLRREYRQTIDNINAQYREDIRMLQHEYATNMSKSNAQHQHESSDHTKIIATSPLKRPDRTGNEDKLENRPKRIEKASKTLEHERVEKDRERSEVETLRAGVANAKNRENSASAEKESLRNGGRNADGRLLSEERVGWSFCKADALDRTSWMYG